MRPAAVVTRLTTCLAACFFLLTVGCSDASTGSPLTQTDGNAKPGDGDSDDSSDDEVEEEEDQGDNGTESDPSDDDDSSSSEDDSDTTETGDGDSSSSMADAGTGGFDLGSLFPPAPAADAGAAPSGPRDVNGPCKDLMLFCIDPFDMFIFNPSDCFTCNGGKGCQGCAVPYAY